MNTEEAPFRLINLSDMAPDWNWIEEDFHAPNLAWKHFSTDAYQLPSILPKKQSFARFLSANNSINYAKNKPSILVSHAPRTTFYAAQLAALKHSQLPHLAVSFTFTNLPTGIQHKLMAKAYQQVDRFVLYSTMEKKLYADYFDLDDSKIDMIHWPIHPPKIEAVGQPLESGKYICAVGSQGRDYGVLFKAMEKLPHLRLVVVVKPENIAGLKIPDNVKVYTNIPMADCNNIIHYSQFMVLPLLHDTVPCGHGSIVSAMFFKKAILITDAVTVKDYIKNDITGRFFTHQDDRSLREAIESLWESPKTVTRLAQNGYDFAHAHCTEQTAVNYFKNYLASKRTTTNQALTPA